MPYPNSPFPDDFIIENLIKCGADDDSTVTKIQIEEFRKILKWLCETPTITYFRVNTLKYSVSDAITILKEKLDEVTKYCAIHNPLNHKEIILETHNQFKNVITIYDSQDKLLKKELKKYDKEVIVDVKCGSSILRGAHLYAPGVLAMMSGTQVGDIVSIYADIAKKCRKGFQKKYDCDSKIFIGNGIVILSRNDLFLETSEKSCSGIAVRIFETISNCLSIGDDWPHGLGLLQNFPSIVCVEVLDPKPGQIILDMCAAPGNKTTLIAAKTQCQGELYTLDKTPAKAQQLLNRCNEFELDNYGVFQANSTKLTNADLSHIKFYGGILQFKNLQKQLTTRNFDKILLDAPCSGLGQRPQLLNTTSLKVLNSYVPLQRLLFSNAVELLKVNGVLVYSTCTIKVDENEGIVCWALRTFKCLELVDAAPRFGTAGICKSDLLDSDRCKLQRFGPEQNTVGFFIAKFIKRF